MGNVKAIGYLTYGKLIKVSDFLLAKDSFLNKNFFIYLFFKYFIKDIA